MTLVEMATRSGVGARLWVPDGVDPFVHLFSESAGVRSWSFPAASSGSAPCARRANCPPTDRSGGQRNRADAGPDEQLGRHSGDGAIAAGPTRALPIVRLRRGHARQWSY
jgi:hypothetical protein